jgi:hypothetical protein
MPNTTSKSRKATPASLAAVIVRKGEATPAASIPAHPATTGQAPEKKGRPETASATYYKALTFKLDRPRYEALKRLGLREDRSSQEILMAALDQYLDLHRA